MLLGFYTEGLKIGQNSLEEKSVGGSESAFLYMAREMAKLGHEVKVFCNFEYNQKVTYRRDVYGIDWFDVSEFPQLSMMLQFDAFLNYRFYNLFQHKINSRLNILVNHDVIMDEKHFMTCAWQIDHLFNLSKFHVDTYLEKLPELKNHIWQTKNGVDLEAIDESIKDSKNRENRVVYASRPERGLERLLTMWPEIHRTQPNLILAICGYELSENVKRTLPTALIEFYAQIETLASSLPNVELQGNLKKQDFWRLLRTSKALVYPTHFPEISCIAALEAMACGTPVISTDNFALSETVGDKGILIKGNPDSPEYQQTFIGKLNQMLTHSSTWEQKSMRGRRWVEQNYQWKDIAKTWVDKIEEMLKTRFYRNKDKVYDQLFYNSDVVAAKRLAEKNNDTEVANKADRLLYLAKTYKEEYGVGGYDVFNTEKDYGKNPRFGHMIDWLKELGIKSIVDVGCHFGSFAISASNIIPDLYVTGFDLSVDCVAKAEELKAKYGKNPEKVTFSVFNLLESDLPDSKAEALFAGELLEHLEDTQTAVNKLEACVKDDGWILLTVPSGPWEAISFKDRPERFHVHHFELSDIKDLFGRKKSFEVRYVPSGFSPRGVLLGWWLIRYRKSDAPCGEVDYSRKEFTRPYQFISYGMITLNEEDNLSRCLKSIRDIVDEIVICDTGSTDGTLEIAQKFTDKVFSITNNPDNDGKGNFAWWRNQVLTKVEKQSDWFLWMDGDEVLLHPDKIRKYVHSPIYLGYVLSQNHVIFDLKESKPDTPVRLFKLNKGISFFGCIHEQPMLGLNDHIKPVYILPDTHVLHYGYITEEIRRRKCADRNIPLLLKDRRMNPDRRISLVLLIRDFINLTNWEVEREKKVEGKSLVYLRKACEIFEKEFKYKFDDQYYEMAFSLYQNALSILGKGEKAVVEGGIPPIQIALTLAGAIGGLSKNRYDQNQFWFKDDEEVREWLSRKGNELFERLNYPTMGRAN